MIAPGSRAKRSDARRNRPPRPILQGRAGRNVVASWSELEAQNFGLETTLDYDTPFRETKRLSESDKAALMGGTLQNVYKW